MVRRLLQEFFRITRKTKRNLENESDEGKYQRKLEATAEKRGIVGRTTEDTPTRWQNGLELTYISGTGGSSGTHATTHQFEDAERVDGLVVAGLFRLLLPLRLRFLPLSRTTSARLLQSLDA